MNIITILSQKGGTGKTTLTTNLAVTATLAGLTTAIIDLDPQASATEWSDARNNETPPVISAHAARLKNIINTAENNNVHLILIDTPPHSHNDALAAAREANLILIPCRPAVFDLKAIKSSIQITTLLNRNPHAILNATTPNNNLANEAEEALRTLFNINVLKQRVGNRIAFVHAATNGLATTEFEPKGKAAEEIVNLWNEIRTLL